MKSKSIKKSKKTADFSVLLLCCIVFFMPFFRGLFFEKEFYVASIIISTFALGVNIKLFKEKENLKIDSLTELFAIAFVMIYVITFPFSINKQMASFEIIKNLTYLIVFIIISNKLKTSLDLSIVNWTIMSSAAVVAIIGLGAALGTFVYNGAFEGGMISSTFQYHNSFGAYMLAALFLTMGEISSSYKNDWKLMASDVIAYLLFTGFILSYSRGAWVLLPVGGLVAFIFLKDTGLKKTITHLVSIIFSFTLTIFFLSNSIVNKNSVKGWLFIIIGMILSVLISYFLDKVISQRFSNIKIRKGIVILVIGVVAFVSIVLIMSGVLDNVLPETFVSRLKGISFKTFTVVERNVFYKDALKIIKDYPILGAGGGGWNTLYSMYKTYDYTTTQAHNYFVQTWVEIGTIGLVLLIGIFISFLLNSYRIIKCIKEDEIYNRALGIICAGVVLVLHSMIDFDMSLGGYAIFVWIVYGAISALYKQNVEKRFIRSFRLPSYVFTIIALLVLIPTTLFSIGQSYGNKAINSVENGNIAEAQKQFEKAAKYAPFVSTYRFDLGNIQHSIGNQIGDELLKIKGIENIETTMNESQFDFVLLSHGLTVYYRMGEFEKISEIGDMLLKHHPLNDSTYNRVIEAYYNVGTMYLESGENHKAKEYFSRIKDVEIIINDTNNSLNQLRETLLEGVKDAPQAYIEERFSITIDQNAKELIEASKNI